MTVLQAVAAVVVLPDEIEFRRVLAAPYPKGGGLRDVLDIEVNGRSLARALDAAPFDVDVIRSGNTTAAWSRTGGVVPILNCTCGDIDCGGFYVDVVADDRTIMWIGAALERSLTFDRAEFESSLAAALWG